MLTSKLEKEGKDLVLGVGIRPGTKSVQQVVAFARKMGEIINQSTPYTILAESSNTEKLAEALKSFKCNDKILSKFGIVTKPPKELYILDGWIKYYNMNN